MVFNNALVGQNGFFTASLIGGTLYLLPVRPVLAGICLGLLTYKPQYGLLFPIVLIAASQWTVFFTAGVVAAVMAFRSWLAFGTESWQAFFHWMPMFSQAFLTEGKARGGSCRAFLMVRYLGVPRAGMGIPVDPHRFRRGGARADVASRVPYTLKASALAVGALLTTPYLFPYDMMVLAIPVAS